MKTCKKCKKQLANNIKICKNCGADLSKVKPTPNKTTPKIKVEVVEKTIEKPIVNVEPNTEFLFTSDFRSSLKKIKEEKKPEVKEPKKIKDKEKASLSQKLKLEETKKKIEQIKNKTKEKRELKKRTKEEITKQLEELFDDKYDIESDIPDLLFAEKFKLQKRTKTKTIKIKKEKKKDKSIPKKKLKDIKIKDLFKKDKTKKVKNKKTKTKKKIKQIKEPETLKLTKAQQIKLAKKKLKRRKTIRFVLIVILFMTLGYVGYTLVFDQIDLGIIITDENRNKTYQMGEKITYKKISYTIDSVETSQGTAYRKPKEGNEYLIITITFENNSEEKHKYSSEDWKMINSLGEETTRIISPVNAGKALYSGELVVGATKTASLVFEQPIKDDKLEIRYYDPIEMKKYLEEKEEEEKRLEQEKLEHPENFVEEKIDEKEEEEKPKVDEKYPKPIFKVKIKVK